MQFYVSKFLTLFTIVVFLCSSCSNSQNNKENSVDVKTLDWAKRTSFKLDFNDEYAYIEDLKRADKSLVQTILAKVEKGEVEAFHFFDKTQMSKTEIDQLFYPKDTVSVYDINLEKEVMKPSVGELNKATIQKVRVEQEWYFDEKDFSMRSKIIAIAPMKTIYNSDGSVRGETPLFWVFMN